MSRNRLPAILLIVLLYFVSCKQEYTYPFQDPDLDVAERVENLVSLLTIEEKISLLHVTSPAVPRLGIEEYHYGNEALHGIVRRNGQATVFPQAIGMAATWNPDLIRQVATAISDEARAKHNEAGGKLSGGAEFGGQFNGLLTFFSPTINMARDPRWGRTSETYGEDPYLTSQIAKAFITGMQGDHPVYLKTITTPKHFATYNEEHNRFTNNVNVSEKTLYEYYFPAFKASIKEAKAGSIMAAYNAINGIPCNANSWLLNEVLRDDWGFEGYVVADCGAINHLYTSRNYSKTSVDAVAEAINSGVDLECGGKKDYMNSLPEALEQGLISEETIDRAVSNILKGRFLLGMFDPPRLNLYNKIDPETVGSDKHVELALQTARESIVLLKNNGLLPIDFEKNKRILVLGPNADVCQFGEPNYSGIPKNPPVTPLHGLEKIFPSNIEINYLPWQTEIFQGIYSTLKQDYIKYPDENGMNGFKSEYYNNPNLTGKPVYSRIDPEINFDWVNQAPDPFYNYSGFSARFTGNLNPPISGDYIFRISSEGKYTIELNDILISEKELSNKDNPEEIKVKLNKNEFYFITVSYYQAGAGSPSIKIEWKFNCDKNKENLYHEYEQAALSNDLIICFLGLNSHSAVEGKDRTTLNLPENQLDFIKAIYKRNNNIIVVLINGNPLSVNWIDKNIPAVLEAWFPGEQGGIAIGEVLSGLYNPSGKLPLTFYKSIDQLPPFDCYEISKGHTYMFLKNKPLYLFGHGLSYSNFEYADFNINSTNLGKNDTIQLVINIRNNSMLDGEEVVQLYTHKISDDASDHLRKLNRFKKVLVEKNKTIRVQFTLPVHELETYNETKKSFEIVPGTYKLFIGSSSDDIRIKQKFSIL